MEDNIGKNEEDTKDKSGRLLNVYGQGYIIEGWYQILRAVVGIGFFVYIIYFLFLKEKSVIIQQIGLFSTIIALVIFLLIIFRTTAVGIWEIILGKAVIKRQKWVYHFFMFFYPVSIFLNIISFFLHQPKDTAAFLGYGSIFLLLVALWYYNWSIRDKFI